MSKDSQVFINFGKSLSMLVGLPTVTSWNTKNRPKNPRRGVFGFNSETNSLEYYNGNFWLEASMIQERK